MRITFIVPFYNAEGTLARCLDSVRGQNCSDWSCLCMNDGSTDASQVLAERFAREDNRFTLFSQKNAGAAAVRNRLLESVQGDYTVFLDADDTLHPEAVSHLVAAATASPDMVIGNVRRVRQCGKRDVLYKHLSECGGSFESILELCCFQYVPGKAYRTAFLRENAIRFADLRTYEDEYFLTQALLRADEIVFIDEILYDYYFNEASLTNATGRKYEKKHDRIRSAIMKQELSSLARQRGELWKQALDISCLESAREAFASLSNAAEFRTKLFEEAHVLSRTMGPIPWRKSVRLWGYALIARAFRKKSLWGVSVGCWLSKRFPLY